MFDKALLATTAMLMLGTASVAQTIAPTAAPAGATAPATTAAPAAAATPATPAGSAAPAAAAPVATAAADIGVQPMTDVAAPNYVAWAWDSNNYEIDAAKVAVRKATRPDVKSYAQQMLDSHETMLKSLQASLKNPSREYVPPTTRLSPGNVALIKQLEDAPAASFDNLYLTQQITAHQKAWSLNKGFANVGQDDALKAVATTNVPMIEQHFAEAKGLAPSNLASR
jgi:putative membrane protein